MADQARGTARASIAFPQQLTPAFFPCRQVAAFLAGRQKSRLSPSSAGAAGLAAAGRSLPGQGIAIEAAMDAARAKQTEITMATIGTFTASDTGYAGVIKTLTLNIKAKLVASEKDNDKAPDYRIFAGSTEFGAAWKKTVRDSEREYLSVKLDDPSFPAPIYAILIEAEGQEGLQLGLGRTGTEPQAHRPRRKRRAFSSVPSMIGSLEVEVLYPDPA